MWKRTSLSVPGCFVGELNILSSKKEAHRKLPLVLPDKALEILLLQSRHKSRRLQQVIGARFRLSKARRRGRHHQDGPEKEGGDFHAGNLAVRKVRRQAQAQYSTCHLLIVGEYPRKTEKELGAPAEFL